MNTGFINGYRWGIEYPTNGKKPDLANDVLVDVKCKKGSGEWQGWTDMTVADTAWTEAQNYISATSFKIIDERYKPSDTSYLDAPNVKESLMDEWYDYDNQKAIALPKAGEYCQVYLNGWYNCYIVGLDDLGGCVFRKDGEYMQRITDDSFRPLDHNRKSEAEKKRVVDAAMSIVVDAHMLEDILGSLYDAGYLRLPDTDKGE
jgi:hypothetical protein